MYLREGRVSAARSRVNRETEEKLVAACTDILPVLYVPRESRGGGGFL
jgi:hypothetical protein